MKTVEINFQRVVLNLRTAGLSCAAQDRRIGREKGYTQRIARGDTKEVWFDAGLKLLDLHLDHCRDRHKIEELAA